MFEWNERKDLKNQAKHGVSFHQAKKALFDPQRIIVEDLGYSKNEDRYFCIGEVDGGVMTV